MVEEFSCPVCGSDRWVLARRYEYSVTDHERGGRWFESPYVRLRRRVLFEIWLPGEDCIVLTSQYCRRCGFMCYRPRPTVGDIDNKYAFLRTHEVNIGAQHDTSELGLHRDHHRALRVYAEVGRFGSVPGKRVLDVGGGDGKLLLPFLQAGCDCFIVDHNPTPKPGIQRLGAVMRDIPPGMRFDVIVCSHVLEHVADPVGFLKELVAYLEPDGRAYFEVPLEIWQSIPIEAEPVTHVNFFTSVSFANVLCMADLEIQRMRRMVGTYGSNRMEVIWSVVRPRSRSSRAPLLDGGRDTAGLLHPNAVTKLKRTVFVETKLEQSIRPVVKLFGLVLKKLATTAWAAGVRRE